MNGIKSLVVLGLELANETPGRRQSRGKEGGLNIPLALSRQGHCQWATCLH